MIIWLGSYPRSGIAVLREVLHRCFALPTYSMQQQFGQPYKYPISIAGQIDCDDWDSLLAEADTSPDPYLIATLGAPSPGERGIYLVRDGRAACHDYWEMLKTLRTADGQLAAPEGMSLEEVVLGRTASGHWSHHAEEWMALGSNVLVVSYERLIANDPTVVQDLAVFLRREAVVLSLGVCPRDLATTPDLYRRYDSNAQGIDYVNRRCRALFEAAHGEMMGRLGYS